MDRSAARQAALDALAEAEAVLGEPSTAETSRLTVYDAPPLCLEMVDPTARASVTDTDVAIEVDANIITAVAVSPGAAVFESPDTGVATESPETAPPEQTSIFFDSKFQRYNATRASVFGTNCRSCLCIAVTLNHCVLGSGCGGATVAGRMLKSTTSALKAFSITGTPSEKTRPTHSMSEFVRYVCVLLVSIPALHLMPGPSRADGCACDCMVSHRLRMKKNSKTRATTASI
jgi:hypothetical protein